MVAYGASGRMATMPARPDDPLVPARGAAIEQLVGRVAWDARGLVPVVAQQWDTGEVLMLAWADAEALRRTLATGRATYWSRSRQAYWTKGQTSGHTQQVREVRVDCDGDTVLLRVEQAGPACHTGTRTCFDDGLLAARADESGAAP